MKYLLLIPFLLSGCATVVPVERHFPEVPKEINESCHDLVMLESNTTKLSDVITNVTTNYSQYHECRGKVDAWVEWYKQQKQTFEEVE